MTDDNGNGGYLANIGLFMTYKCQVACPHCVAQAGPHRTEAILEHEAADWIGQAARYRDGVIKAVNLTGGEPFFDLPALQRLVALIVQNGLLPTAVTNAHWAVSPGAARETLSRVPDLLLLQVSTDEHHQREIPFERVLNAIDAAEALGIVYRVAVCTEDVESPRHAETIRRLHERVDASRVETIRTFPTGRAAHGQVVRLLHFTSEPPEGACAGADSPLILPDGRVVSCVGPIMAIGKDMPLVLGNLRERPLAEILDAAEKNPLLHLIRAWGPATLLDLLKGRGIDDRLPTRFVPGTLCDLCYRLFSDDSIVAVARDLSREPEFVEVVARGRRQRLGEDGMIPLTHL